MTVSTAIFDDVNLARMPAPDVVETLEPSELVQTNLADFVALYPEFSALTPADPAFKLVEYFTYRELLLRQRINEAARAVMLPFATGADLDNLGAAVNLARKVIIPANAALGIAETIEDDIEFRARIQRAPEAYSVAGPASAYVMAATRADNDVRFASAVSLEYCEVIVTLQSYSNDGVASAALVQKILAHLSGENIRPLGDRLIVQAAEPVDYAVDATLTLYDGPDAAMVLAAATDSLAAYRAGAERLGNDINLSALHRALHVEGVQRVTLNGFNDLVIAPHQFARAASVNISFGGRDV
jgi:phage-related baseplate assembly protein